MSERFERQVVILAAGEGRRFKDAGYARPKPLILLEENKTILECVVEDCVRELDPRRLLVITRAENEAEVIQRLLRFSPTVEVAVKSVPATTAGAAATALLAEDWAAPLEPLFVVNSDQRFELDQTDRRFVQDFASQFGGREGSILYFKSAETKWSYATLNRDGRVKIVEKPKRPPSFFATVGVYGFREASACFQAVRAMMAAEDRTNGEFYFAPCYNHVPEGFRTDLYAVKRMDGLGTPEDLERYLGT